MVDFAEWQLLSCLATSRLITSHHANSLCCWSPLHLSSSFGYVEFTLISSPDRICSATQILWELPHGAEPSLLLIKHLLWFGSSLSQVSARTVHLYLKGLTPDFQFNPDVQSTPTQQHTNPLLVLVCWSESGLWYWEHPDGPLYQLHELKCQHCAEQLWSNLHLCYLETCRHTGMTGCAGSNTLWSSPPLLSDCMWTQSKKGKSQRAQP